MQICQKWYLQNLSQFKHLYYLRKYSENKTTISHSLLFKFLCILRSFNRAYIQLSMHIEKKTSISNNLFAQLLFKHYIISILGQSNTWAWYSASKENPDHPEGEADPDPDWRAQQQRHQAEASDGLLHGECQALGTEYCSSLWFCGKLNFKLFIYIFRFYNHISCLSMLPITKFVYCLFRGNAA